MEKKKEKKCEGLFSHFFCFFIFTHVSCVCSTQPCRYLLCRPHSHHVCCICIKLSILFSGAFSFAARYSVELLFVTEIRLLAISTHLFTHLSLFPASPSPSSHPLIAIIKRENKKKRSASDRGDRACRSARSPFRSIFLRSLYPRSLRIINAT